MKIAALFVREQGNYFNLDQIDPYGMSRDARLYLGPHPVIAHPPCERWGRYWSGGPNPNAKRQKLGDDQGCFESALKSVRTYGGVLEHPEASHAFRVFELGRPPKEGGWIRSLDGIGWICCVEQGHYGHLARKATWLYYVGSKYPPDLIWGPSVGIRMEDGFHSSEERRLARHLGIKPCERLSKNQRIDTPIGFRNLLISLVRVS